MRLKDAFKLDVLLEYGFAPIDEHTFGEDEGLIIEDGYALNLGHSRRGQFYYLICNENKQFAIYASKPDGAGAPLALNTIVIQLIEAGLVGR